MPLHVPLYPPAIAPTTRAPKVIPAIPNGPKAAPKHKTAVAADAPPTAVPTAPPTRAPLFLEEDIKRSISF